MSVRFIGGPLGGTDVEVALPLLQVFHWQRPVDTLESMSPVVEVKTFVYDLALISVCGVWHDVYVLRSLLRRATGLGDWVTDSISGPDICAPSPWPRGRRSA